MSAQGSATFSDAELASDLAAGPKREEGGGKREGEEGGERGGKRGRRGERGVGPT